MGSLASCECTPDTRLPRTLPYAEHPSWRSDPGRTVAPSRPASLVCRTRHPARLAGLVQAVAAHPRPGLADGVPVRGVDSPAPGDHQGVSIPTGALVQLSQRG